MPGKKITDHQVHKFKKPANRQRKWLRRRSAVEPVIGHLKADHDIRRCWLKGEPRWPGQTAPLMATQTAPPDLGKTGGL